MEILIRKGLRYLLYKYNSILKFIPNKEYLEIAYYLNTGRKLNLNNPIYYTEKLQWLKLNYNNPNLSYLVDKYAVKDFVSSIIGQQYIIPTIGVYDRFEDINFDELPKQFVIKCTHDSGGIVICKDKNHLDYLNAKQKIEKCLRRDYYFAGREMAYKNVPHKILIENYLEDDITKELRDYKFFCFDGKVKLMFVASDRQKENEDTKFDFFDMNFNHLNITNGHPNSKCHIEKPTKFMEMVKLAEQLSIGFPHVRCDFYEVNGKVYFGEMTFFHHSGFVLFEPEKWEKQMGSYINLRKYE